jgi:hypothetical protein
MEPKIVSRCRHVKINGARCTMPGWKASGLCFEHNFRYEQQQRRPDRPRQGFSPLIPFVWIEDESSVLHNLNLISQALGNCEIDHRQASAMTCVQRTCLRTLRQIHEQRKHAQPSEPVVADCIEADGGQLLVPLEPTSAPPPAHCEPAAASSLNAPAEPLPETAPDLVIEPAVEVLFNPAPAPEVANLCTLTAAASEADPTPASLLPVPCSLYTDLTPAFPTPAPQIPPNPFTSHTYAFSRENSHLTAGSTIVSPRRRDELIRMDRAERFSGKTLVRNS